MWHDVSSSFLKVLVGEKNAKKNSLPCLLSLIQTVGKEAVRMGVTGPWITKSYLELILEQRGLYHIFFPFLGVIK